MPGTSHDQPLRIALIVVGAIFVVGLYPLTVLWPAGFMWEPRQAEYEQMVIGVYAVLGIFLLLAARNPAGHRSLIWFAAWSSLVHGLIMLVQALRDSVERPNLIGDVPALILIGLVLAILMRKAEAGWAAGARTP